MKPAIFVCALLFFIASTCSAQSAAGTSGPDLEATLQKRYLNQMLILRHAVKADSQTYDAQGNLVNAGEEGPWTVCGPVSVTKINAGADELRIEGTRMSLVFDSRSSLLAPVKSKKRVRLSVQLGKPLVSIEEAEAVLHRIFAMSDDDIIQSVPEFWKPYFAKRAAEGARARAAGKPVKETAIEDAGTKIRKKKQARVVRPTEEVVLHDGSRVTPPQAVFTPEPESSEPAKEATTQGTVVLSAVVDETGKVVNPVIFRPLGMGLDEKAIESVKTWRFKPARKNGQPVKAEIALEIVFNIY